MRKVVVTEFLTLDGVMEAPDEWQFPYWNDEIEKFKHNELFASDAQLLGRVTFQGFADAWPSMTGAYADRLNSLPKYVVSTTLGKAEWNNSSLIKGNVAEEIHKLQQQPGQDILVHGSRTLVQALMQYTLIDEYNLLIHPVVLGKGKPLFTDGMAASLKLTGSITYGSGVVLLNYQPEKKES
jgi:dihydrofolate reductase